MASDLYNYFYKNILKPLPNYVVTPLVCKIIIPLTGNRFRNYQKMNKKILFVICALWYFYMIGVDFHKLIFQLTVLLPLAIIVIVQLVNYFKKPTAK